MEIGVSQFGSVCVLHPRGRIDSTTAPEFNARLLQAVAETTGGVIVSFAECNYISSAGLRSLMTAMRQRKDRRVAVAALGAILHEIFVIARFQHVIPMFGTIEEAASSWGVPTGTANTTKEAHTREG